MPKTQLQPASFAQLVTTACTSRPASLSETTLGQLLGAQRRGSVLHDSPLATAPLRPLMQDGQAYLHSACQHRLSLEALAPRFALSKYKLIR